MAIIRESWQETISVGTTSALSVAVSSGVTAGDLIVIIIGNDDSTDTTQFSINDTNHPGWTKVLEAGDSASDTHLAIFWKEAGASEGAITVDSASANDTVAYYIRYSGADVATPVHKNISISATASATHAVTGQDTTIDDCLLLSAISLDGGDGIPFSVNNSYTVTDEGESNVGSQGVSVAFAERTLATAGAMGTTTWTPDVSDGAALFQIAIAPSSDVNITSDFDTLTLTEYTSTVNDKTEIVSDFDTLTLTDHDSIAKLATNVVSDFDTLTLTDYDSSINDKTQVTSDHDTLTLTGYNSIAKLTANIVSDFDTLTLTDYDSSINDKTQVTSDHDTLTLTGYDALLNVKKNVTSDFDTFTLLSYDTEAKLTHSVLSDHDTLTLTGYDALLNVKKNVTSDFDTFTLLSYDTEIELIQSVTSDFALLSLNAYDSLLNVKQEITSDFDTISLTSYDSTVTGNSLKNIVSQHSILTLTAHDSSARLVPIGIFNVKGALKFRGYWNISNT